MSEVDLADVEMQFLAAAARRGIIIRKLIADGRLHRADVEGKNGKGDAAYILHLDGIPAGGFENHKDGIGWQNWRADVAVSMTAAERAVYRAEMKQTRARREQEHVRTLAQARLRASGLLRNAIPADEKHPYLRCKGVGAHGIFQRGEVLVIPMRDAAGTLHSLQFIAADGSKRFLRGGRKIGCHHLTGEPQRAILVAEGYATAASIFEATNCATVCAFDAGNLGPVAQALRVRYPEARIIFCADSDKNGTGSRKASEAAQAIGGAPVALPEFGDDPDLTDFNDLAGRLGKGAVREQILKQVMTWRA